MLVKANLTQLETLESLEVLWNPESYGVTRRSYFARAHAPGGTRSVVQAVTGGEERFSARLFLDATDREGPSRDLRPWVSRLEAWAEPGAGAWLPPRILFHWGSFRFRGVLAALDLQWVSFDADGVGVRAWLDLALIR